MCVVESADEDPISSPVMSLADWEVQDPVEMIALTNKCGEDVLFYEAQGDLCTQTGCCAEHNAGEALAKASRILFLTLSLWSELLRFLAW